jgi:citronellol/citronellal dehydrogenase
MPGMDELRLNPVYYGPEHLALRDTLRRFVAREITPYAHEWDEAGGFPRELYRKAAVAAIVAARGRIHGLVNNAGGQFPAPLAGISAKGWQAVIANNLTGGFLMARECYNQCMRQHGGAIVNMLADMWQGMPGMGHSGAARAGMLNFTETAACEWAPVRVNAVAPGWIASSGMDTYPDAMKPLIRSLPQHVPAHRFGTEAEVSAAIVFLLSEGACFVSGACLRIDGAAPNARRHWMMGGGKASPEYDGFHRSRRPRVIED